ncbi:MAG: rRNA maturation RNase YbeY [Bacteroidota bacterium]
MSSIGINFFSEAITFQLDNQDVLAQWLHSVVLEEKKAIECINFIFCSDEYLHKINVAYLNHDTYTDVITFPYAAFPVEGDVFISIERVKENAEQYQVDFTTELHRVMVHGTLHLLNYLDKSVEEKRQMTRLENKYLQRLALKPN